MGVKINKKSAPKVKKDPIDKTKPSSSVAGKTSGKVSLPNGDLVQAALGNVMVEKNQGGHKTSSESTEEIAAIKGPGPFANVGLTATRTINLGNYESIKIGVSVYIPCESTQNELDASYEFAKEWVDDKMCALIDEFKPGE